MQNERIIDYDLIMAVGYTELVAKVKSKILLKWEPQGPAVWLPNCNGFSWGQTMVKYES